MRLKGGRTGKRAVVCEDLELTGLMKPFDLEVWYGERVAVLGSNGSGKSHFLRLLAAGGTDPDVEHRPVSEVPVTPVPHTGKAKLGARVRPGWFVQTHEHPELVGRTLLDILHRGDGHPGGRGGLGREQAARVLDRYELAHAGEQTFDSLSGGQQARFQILLLELSGATLLLLDEPTDNLDVQSAEALEEGLEAFAGHGARRHPRPLVRPRLRPVPGLRRRRRGVRVTRPGLGRGPGRAGQMSQDTEGSTAMRIELVDPFDDATYEAWHAVYLASQQPRPPRAGRDGVDPAGDACRAAAARTALLGRGLPGQGRRRGGGHRPPPDAAARQPRPGAGLRRRAARAPSAGPRQPDAVAPDRAGGRPGA